MDLTEALKLIGTDDPRLPEAFQVIARYILEVLVPREAHGHYESLVEDVGQETILWLYRRATPFSAEIESGEAYLHRVFERRVMTAKGAWAEEGKRHRTTSPTEEDSRNILDTQEAREQVDGGYDVEQALILEFEGISLLEGVAAEDYVTAIRDYLLEHVVEALVRRSDTRRGMRATLEDLVGVFEEQETFEACIAREAERVGDDPEDEEDFERARDRFNKRNSRTRTRLIDKYLPELELEPVDRRLLETFVVAVLRERKQSEEDEES